ncbi:MAG: hypothetical protein RLZZ524_1907 [Pseudomonadota bacterium]|jgi:hypothetical protein
MKLLVPFDVTDANFVSSNVTENDHPVIVNGQAYTAGTRVIYQHAIYEAQTSNITSWVPPAAPTEWLRIGPTNRWAMFDGVVGTITSRATSIQVQVSFNGVVNDLVLMRVVGTSVQVVMPGVNTTVAVPAAGPEGSTVVISNMGSTGGTMTLTLTGTGTVSIGNMSVGVFNTLGDDEWGGSLGIVDYSKKEFDDFGNPNLVIRDYSRTYKARVAFATSNFDTIVRILTAVRSKPVVWQGVTGLQSMVLLGYYKDFSARMESVNRSTVELQIESLALGDVGA